MQSNNNYSYIDGLNQYTYANGVLKNLANIQEERALLLYESLKVSKRIEELFEQPIKITNSALAYQKGYSLNLNPPNNKDIYDRYMKGTINSDVDILTKLIENQIIEISI